MVCSLLKCTFGKCVFYQRYILVIFLQLALLNAYHARVVLNIAITEMVADRNVTFKVNECPQYTYEKVEHVEGGTFPWDNNKEALILYAFYCSYFISHVPGGWLADKYGARHVMGSCMVVSTIVTLLFPIGLQYGGSTAAILLRFILGFAQGPLLPVISTFIQCWIPKDHRTVWGGIAFGGSNMGTVTGNLFTGMMIKNSGSWTQPFYVWGFMSLAFCFFFYIYVFSRPSSHPFITDEEREYLEAEVEHRKTFKVPWLQICSSGAVWALLAGQFSHNILFFTIVTNLSKYHKEILKLDIQSNALATAIPFLGLWVTNIFFSSLTNVLINRGVWSLNVARKANTLFASLVPSSCLVLAVYIGCNRTAAITLYILAVTLLGPFFAGMKVNVNDITIHYGGTIMAIINGIGSTAGIFGPFLVGLLTEEESFHSWKICFWILFASSGFCSIMYCIFAKVERQQWDFVDD